MASGSIHPPDTPFEAQFPIRYNPTPLPSRRITISDLPSNIHLYSILKCIHSGPLVSATIADTTPHLGTKTALIEFLHHEHASAFLASLPDGTLLLTSEESGTVLHLPVRRPSTSSAPVPRRIHVPMRNGMSRLLVATNFPRRCIYPFLVQATLHRGMGLDSLVEASYTDDKGSPGMGRLSLEFTTVSLALRAQDILIRRPGILPCRLPMGTPHSFALDPCQGTPQTRPIGPLDLPQNVKDPVRFFTLHEFLALPLHPHLPDPNHPLKSTGLITTTLDLSPESPASCPARYAEKEFATKPWTHTDPDTGARRVRIPFGWSMTVADWWKDIVGTNLETEVPERQRVLDGYFEATGGVNLRKLVALGKGKQKVPCGANLWGILKG